MIPEVKKPRMTAKRIAQLQKEARDAGYTQGHWEGWNEGHKDTGLPTLAVGAIIGAFSMWAYPIAWRWIVSLFA